MDGCRHLTDESVEAVAQFCPNLNILIFHGCSNITGRMFEYHWHSFVSLYIITLVPHTTTLSYYYSTVSVQNVEMDGKKWIE